jgi:hypothetical protein
MLVRIFSIENHYAKEACTPTHKYAAFGDTGAVFRNLEWRAPTVSEKVVLKTPHAP